ncbi:MAG: hypothetical protein KatS3mg083_259 [Candidatus Dojkabacteria bacterium]|nr:MAG: hypothetical protein KatS3mg083_259 [Candidatus Dojkabacteria bacterium]
MPVDPNNPIVENQQDTTQEQEAAPVQQPQEAPLVGSTEEPKPQPQEEQQAAPAPQAPFQPPKQEIPELPFRSRAAQQIEKLRQYNNAFASKIQQRIQAIRSNPDKIQEYINEYRTDLWQKKLMFYEAASNVELLYPDKVYRAQFYAPIYEEDRLKAFDTHLEYFADSLLEAGQLICLL